LGLPPVTLAREGETFQVLKTWKVYCPCKKHDCQAITVKLRSNAL